MQSVFQYRRIGRQVADQLSRKGARPDTTDQNPSSISEPPEARSRAEQDSTLPDLEKAERLEGTQDSDVSSRPDKEEEEEEEEREEVEEPEPIDSRTESHGIASQDHALDSRPSLHRSLSRVSTRSIRTVGTRLGLTLTGINVRDRTTNEGGDRSRQVFVVEYSSSEDPMNPHNWPRSKRVMATINVALIGLIVGFASSIDSSILENAAEEFGVSEVVESMATGLFLVGFGFGALFAGPISETLGRNPVYIATLAMYMIFIMASALAPNIGAQLVFRFIAGFFGSTPLTCAGGSIADMWNPMERVYTFPVFANAAFMGPILGPVVGGFIAGSPLVGWRWTDWITLILSGVVLAIVVLFQPETFTPIILKWKAAHLRQLTKDDRYRAPIEVRADTLWQRLGIALYRPFLLTFQEPIVILVALYLTVIYIILFTFLDGYDYIFAEIHGTSDGITGLMFLGIAAGLCVSSAVVPLVYKWAKRDLAKIKEEGGDRLPPEFRLWFAMLGGSVAIPVSLFWMGWTSDSNISLWSPLIASVLFGYGVLSVFISSYQYIIDSYEIYAASALASVTLLRYVASGGMVVVGIPFYENLGVHYTLTILGCLSALMVPVPYVFYKYGPKIRAMSKYAVAGGTKKEMKS